MATISHDSVQSDIIAAIKKNNVRTLFKDLKIFIETAESQGCRKKGDFLTRVLRYAWKCLALKSEVNRTCEELLNVFEAIEFCVNNILKYYEPEDIQNIRNGQFLTTWYHIICCLLRKKHDEYALRLLTIFENYVQKALNSPVKIYLLAYIDSLHFALWQSATNRENFGTKEIFKRQLSALQLLSFSCQHIYSFCEYSTLSLQQYYKVEETECDVISHFLRTIWCHSNEYLESCSASCAKLLVFQTSYKWFTLFQQKHINELVQDFLFMFGYLNTAVQRFKCAHMDLLNAMAEVVLFCIKSYMNETANTLAKNLQSYEILVKVDEKSPETLFLSYGYQVFILCLSWQAYMCISGSSIGPNLDLMQKNIEALSALSCMYLNYFELVRTTQDLVDYRNVVVSSMMCIILKVMEQINNGPDISYLIPLSVLYLEKINLLCARSDIESQEIYCDVVSGIAKQLVKHYFYKEAIPFLQFVINWYGVILTKDVKIESDETEIWKLNKCLTYCYLSLHMYDEALKSLVIGLLSKKEIAAVDFKYWVKVKRSAYIAKDGDIVKKTIKDVLNEMNLPVCQKKQMSLLENLVFALKKDDWKDYIYEERIAVMLLILVSDPELEIKAWVLIELSISNTPLSTVPTIDGNSTPFSLCQHAANLLIQALEINSDNVCYNAVLSLAYFWMHYHQTRHILDLNLQRVHSVYNKTEERQDETCDKNIEEYGFLPAFLNLRLGIENQLLKYLRYALNIWKEIVCGIAAGQVHVNELHKFHLCKVMLKTAEIFFTSGNENEAVVASFVLHEFSSQSNNEIYDLLSLSSIVKLTTRQGYLKLAKEYIGIAEKLLRDTTNVKIYPKAVFSCAKSLFFLENRKFDEGLEILHSAFEDVTPILNTGRGFAVKVEANLILVRYMQLNKSVFSKICPSDIRGCPYDPIALATRCFGDCQELLRAFFTGEFMDFVNLGSGLNQKIIRLQFESAVTTSELLLKVGLPTKAKLFLTLVTPIAESYFYTNWLSKFLIIWSHADLMCNDYVKCEVKLKALDSLCKVKVHDNFGLKSFDVDSSDESSEEDDDSSLTTVSDVGNKMDFRLSYRKSFSCECNECSLCASNFMLLEINLLKCCYLMTKELVHEAIQLLTEVKTAFNRLCGQNTILENFVMFQRENQNATSNELFQKTFEPKNYVSFLIKLLMQLVVCHNSIEELSEAVSYILEAENFLMLATEAPMIMYPNMFAFITYRKIGVYLKLIDSDEFTQRMYQSVLKSSAKTEISTSKMKITLPTRTHMQSYKCKIPSSSLKKKTRVGEKKPPVSHIPVTSVEQSHGTAPDDSSNTLKERAMNIENLISDLKEAIAVIEHHPPQPLYSDLCKSLASLMMLKLNDGSCSHAFDVAYLLSESFAVSLKSESRFALDKKIEKVYSETLEESFSNKLEWPISDMIDYNKMNFEPQEDLPYYTRMKSILRNIPEQWTVVQVCILQDPPYHGTKPGQSLCVCRCRRNIVPYIKLFSIDDQNLEDLNSEFDDICLQNTLSTEIPDDGPFWCDRLALDSRLKNFINNLSERWGADFKALFLGVLDDEERNKRLENSLKKIKCLPHKGDQEMLQIVLDCANTLERNEISSIICALYDICEEDPRHKTIMKCIHAENFDLRNVKRHPVILILDKYVQGLPWENMPFMRNNSVVREPSLYFLNLQLKLYCNESNSLIVDGVDTEKTFYLLNASGEMVKTQEFFEDVFSAGMQWKGVTGIAPLPEEIAGALTDYDLYLYLGHNSGLRYLQKAGDIKALCGKACTVLMGCSSGLLRKDGSEMEASGSAMKYYLSGVPCIVANLWDVTDTDIDVYTYTVLKDWVPDFETGPLTNKWDIAEVVARARRVCTLVYLNGGAPVIYGLPVFAKWDTKRFNNSMNFICE